MKKIFEIIVLKIGKISLLSKILLIIFSLFFISTNLSLAENKIISPYFASIKWNEAKVRTGPGQQYPIRWIFNKKNLPIEILREYERWLKIRYLDGDEGWMHKRLVSKSRYVMVNGNAQILRNKPDNLSNAILVIENRVIAKLQKCNLKWCQVSIKEKNGWVLKSYLWGVYLSEIID